MKTSEIEPGKTYRVHLSERTSLIYRGCDVNARVIRAGFHYEIETETASRVRGAPFHHHHTSLYPTGVEVEWDRQEVVNNRPRRHYNYVPEEVLSGRAIVSSAAVRYLVEEN